MGETAPYEEGEIDYDSRLGGGGGALKQVHLPTAPQCVEVIRTTTVQAECSPWVCTCLMKR